MLGPKILPVFRGRSHPGVEAEKGTKSERSLSELYATASLDSSGLAAQPLRGRMLPGFFVLFAHTITGDIVGVGALRRIVSVWILTIPGAAFIATIIFHLVKFFLPLNS